MKRLFLFLAYLFAMIQQGYATQQTEYGKHVVVVVDQTLHSNPYREEMFSCLVSWLKGEEMKVDTTKYLLPRDFVFDPKKDELSLYGFGLPGSDYSRILKDTLKLGNEYAFADFTNSFIEKTETYQSSGRDFEEFLNGDLRDILFCKTKIRERWEKSPGCNVTLSHYVYPTVLKFIDTDVYASEFILIVISDYQSGSYSEGDGKDETNLENMCGTLQRKDYFKAKINKIGESFVRVDYLDFTVGTIPGKDSSDKNQLMPIRAKGSHLLMKKTVQKTPIFISGGITPIEQVEHLGTDYKLQSARILFNKDENTEVQKVAVRIFDKNGKQIVSDIIIDSIEVAKSYNPETWTYDLKIPGAASLDLESQFAQKLKIDYVFYTISKDDAGNNIMPFILTASREINEEDFDMNEGYFMAGVIAIIVLLLLYLCWQWIRLVRGKDREVELSYRIDPVSHMHFMDVKEDREESNRKEGQMKGLHVLNYDCWYINEGEMQTKIHVRGDIKLLPKFAAKDYKVRLVYMVKDLDEDHFFSFRPDGKEKDGKLCAKDKPYEVKPDENGHFEFDVVVHIARDEKTGNLKQPNYEVMDHILRLGVFFTAQLVNSSAKSSELANNAPGVIKVMHEESNQLEPYSFIVKPNIQNRSLWMAFDPGTSGSCVAFGNGGTIDRLDNTHLAKNYAQIDGEDGWWPVIPSFITVSTDKSTLDKIAERKPLEVKTDFDFGNDAFQQDTHPNRFQSIKKMLGYKDKFKVYGRNGREEQIAGRELAHLIILGLLNNFERFLKENQEDSTKAILPRFMPNGVLRPSRAIVAVPNNYTLPKIYDMVNSIKKTNMFKEVHYLYEAEGIMMTYLRMNWAQLSAKQNYTFVVFDMGGATINATAFRLKVNKEVTSSGHTFTRDVEVSTVSKIGYCVGGDDIDYAIMQVLYNIPQVKAYFNGDKKLIEKHQIDHKGEILNSVLELKKAIIDKDRNCMKSGNMFVSSNALWTYICTMFEKWGIIIPQEYDEENKLVTPRSFIDYYKTELKKHVQMEKYVYQNVRDAVKELMNNDKIRGTKVELIFSGRSTLYPGIVENVEKELKKYCKFEERWHGFDKKDFIAGELIQRLDADKVKTAVVEGACWYAMFSDQIILKHDIVTSTFGYIDLLHDKSKFIPVVERNMEFIAGKRTKEAEVITPTLQNVKFVQMLGSNYDEVYEKDIRHKMNPLIEVISDHIDGVVRSVQISVDDKNNFEYQISVDGQDPLTGCVTAKETEIVDENSPAYIFATTQSNARPKEEEVKKEEKPRRRTL